MTNAILVEEMTPSERAELHLAEAEFVRSRAALAVQDEGVLTIESRALAVAGASSLGTGIDISVYQGHPDFNAVKAAGIARCIMRCGIVSGGRIAVDSVYVANRASARAVGLPIGHYLFNGPMDPTAAADQQFSIMDYQPGEFVVIDVEGSGSTVWTPPMVLAWAQRMLAHSVRLVDLGVYMSSSVTRAQDWSAVAALGLFLWVASYGTNNGQVPSSEPSIAHWGAWSMWQYTSTVTCPGVSGRVDTSLINEGFPPALSTNGDEQMLDGYIYLLIDGTFKNYPIRFGTTMSAPPDPTTGFIVAGIINHGIPASVSDQVQESDPAFGTVTVIKISSENADRLAASLYGAPAGTVNSLFAGATAQERIYPRPGSATSGGGDLAPVLAAIAALDKQSDTYQAELQAILAKGLTISGTATPAK